MARSVMVRPTARRNRRPGPATPTDWKARYLELIRVRGNFARTAIEVGVDPKTAYRERDRDPDFDQACLEARQVFADQCEDDLTQGSITSGNPVGLIVRLKALRPAEYIERQAITTLSLSGDLNTLAPDQAMLVLRAMLSSTTPTTQRALTDGQTERLDVGPETRASSSPPRPE